ncbi:hypothetical protein SDC9_175179 [bioreactor metagenome]|uniref:Uncharacterized protein n=1 Tax=bioreactor metagenome TaxID=1076179 RepID=A0A645GM03_9ZZZZ
MQCLVDGHFGTGLCQLSCTGKPSRTRPYDADRERQPLFGRRGHFVNKQVTEVPLNPADGDGLAFETPHAELFTLIFLRTNPATDGGQCRII